MAGPAWGGRSRPSRPGAADCPLPPHPHPGGGDRETSSHDLPDGGPGWFRSWVAGAPLERAPVPAIPLVWVAGVVEWLVGTTPRWSLPLTGLAVLAALIAAWRAGRRDPDVAVHPTTAAVLAGLAGLWAGLVCARYGPLAGWHGSVSWGWLAAGVVSWQLLARGPAAGEVRRRHAEETAWVSRKAQWHAEIAPLLGMNGWHLTAADKTLIGERWVAAAGPGHRASDVLSRRRKVIEDLTHYLGLSWGEVDLNLTGTPGEIEFWIRTGDPWAEPIWHPLVRPGGEFDELIPGWPDTITTPKVVGIDPETGDPLEVTLWDEHGAKVVGVLAARDGGKALALDTPLPTPAGWTTMGEVQPGDWLLGADGRPCRVTFATEVMHGRACYEVEFRDGSVITADAEHLWLTEDRQAARSAYLARTKGYRQRFFPVVRTTTEIAATLQVPDGRGGTSNHAVANARPLELPAADLLVPPYTLGIWLGDGTAGQAQFTTADPEILARVEADGISTSKMPGHVYDYRLKIPLPARSGSRSGGRRPCGRCGRRCGGSGSGMCRPCWLAVYTFKGALRCLGVLDGKHIPPAYLRASEAQRRDLLAGLLDSDGHCQKDGGIEYSSTSRRLALDFRELVSTLGYSSRLRSKRVRGRTEATSTSWIVSFTPPDKVFCLPRKAERQLAATGSRALQRMITGVRPVPSVPVRCLQVDNADRLYLAGEACIPTHNTTLMDNLCAGILACDDAELIQVNLSKALEDGWWADLAAASALGPGEHDRAAAILEFLLGVIELRPAGGRMTKVHRPTPAAPLWVAKLDELGKTLKTAEDRQRFAEICSVLRSEGVAVVYAEQRGDRNSVGGSDIQAGTNVVIWGKFTRSRELTHVAGREAGLPDMGEYGGGNAGVFGIASLPYQGDLQKGRTFYFGEHQRATRRVVAQLARHREPRLVLEPALADLQGLWEEITGRAPLTAGPSPTAGIRGKIAAGRARLAGITGTDEQDKPRQQAQQDEPGKKGDGEAAGITVPGVPSPALEVLLRLAAETGGVSSRQAAGELGVGRGIAYGWLKKLEQPPGRIVEIRGKDDQARGKGPNQRYYLTADAAAAYQQARAPAGGQAYEAADLDDVTEHVPGSLAGDRRAGPDPCIPAGAEQGSRPAASSTATAASSPSTAGGSPAQDRTEDRQRPNATPTPATPRDN